MANKIIEYNTASIVCGGTNVIEAFATSDSVRFNESYIIAGESLQADEIYGMYDLTVMGDVRANKLIVNGKLYVAGNLCVESIQCTHGITCTGKIQCKQIVCDEDVVATIVDADKIEICGSLLVSTSINVDTDCQVDRNVLVGEGFSGSGRIKADNVMVVDYFDFDGTVSARVFEMETMYKKIQSIETQVVKTALCEMSLDTMATDVKRFYDVCIDKIAESEEETIISLLEECAQIQKESFSEIAFLFSEIVRISYLDKIENLMDFLLVEYASNVFPEKLRCYETIEHVFSQFLEEVEADELEFAVNNIYEFMIALKILDRYFKNDEEIADKVFSFIGIRYRTVKRQFEGVV